MDYKDRLIQDLLGKVANLELVNSQLVVENQLLREQFNKSEETKEGD